MDLSAKPACFFALSPPGKVPMLKIQHAGGVEDILFEKAWSAAPGRAQPLTSGARSLSKRVQAGLC